MDEPTVQHHKFSMQMVAELAARIQEPEQVLERYEVSIEEFARLKQLPAFRKAYTEAKRFWDSDANARERITVKAAAMLEDSLEELYTMFHDAKASGALRMDAFKQMTVLAKVNGGEVKSALAGGGQVVNVNINMGAGKVISATLEQPAGVVDTEFDPASETYAVGDDEQLTNN